MAARSRKIFWGILIASLHVNVFGLEIFPACVGYALVYVGIYDLERGGGFLLLGRRQRRCYRIAAAGLVLSSGLLNFMGVFNLVLAGEIWSMIPLVLEYIVFYFLMEVYTRDRRELSGLCRGYSFVMGAIVTGYGLSLIFHAGNWQALAAAIILVCRLMVLLAVWSDRGAKLAPVLEEAEVQRPQDAAG